MLIYALRPLLAVADNFKVLNDDVITCRLCPRLVHHRETVPAKKQFAGETFWRKPVPGFGDQDATLLILGLAPSPDGGNRTGRLFTGDPSAKFLMRALYETGYANQPFSLSADDGLILKGAYMTASVKCVPPKHHPTREEIKTCSRYLHREFQLLKKLRAVLALGGLAFKAYLDLAKEFGEIQKIPFTHGAIVPFQSLPTLYGSYHPSPQNTNTGKLSLTMLKEVIYSISS